jgi:acetaldehyde dehydrogenase/alcohol dehydrogenase
MADAERILANACRAANELRGRDQTRTDAVVRSIYLAAFGGRVELAQLAHEETGIGVWQHKVVKNVIATQLVYEDIKDERTVGVIGEDRLKGIVELARPLGAILGLVPVTNPTSTTIFKALIAMKTRNPLILSPHQAARRCTAAAAELCYHAARAAGAPEHCIQWLERPAEAALKQIMGDRRLALILATGTPSVVAKAARSGTPVIGVGPGNVPAYVGATADVPFAVSNIMASKTFDNGTVCASEQALVVRRDGALSVRQELERQGGHFLSPEQVETLGRIAYDRERRTMTARVVGQSAERIAATAGFDVPPGTRLLVAPLDGVGPDHPLSAEILAPILAYYEERDFEAAIERCSEITRFGGVGHTAVIHSNSDERIEYFARQVDASRILVNMPATHGALGGMFNTLSPSFTLSCGSGGHNITTDNITARHLLNVHRITRRRPNPRWTGFDASRYLDETLSAESLEAAYNRNF